MTTFPITASEPVTVPEQTAPILRESGFGPYWDFGFEGASMILVTSHAPLKAPYKNWMLPHQLYVEDVARIRSEGYNGPLLVTPIYDRGTWTRVPEPDDASSRFDDEGNAIMGDVDYGGFPDAPGGA